MATAGDAFSWAPIQEFGFGEGTQRMSWTIDDELAWNLSNPFRQHLDVRVERVDEQGAEISLPVTENLLQAYGMVHGGIYCVLIDTVLGAAVRGSYQRDVKPLTTDLNVSFLRPTGLGRIFASAGIIKNGKTIAVGAGEVRDARDRKLAVGQGSFLVRHDVPSGAAAPSRKQPSG